MNKTQRTFKRQMQLAEKLEHKSAKKNKGVFSNKLFELRFYGYRGEYKKPKNLFVVFFVSLFRIIFTVLKWSFIIAIAIAVILIIIAIINKTKNLAIK